MNAVAPKRIIRHTNVVLEYAQPVPQRLIAAEVESLVVPNWTTDREAVLIPLVLRLQWLSVNRKRVLLPAVSVHLVIAQKLEDRSVDLIGARLADSIKDPAAVAAVLGAVAAGDDVELAHRLDAHQNACRAARGTGVVIDIGAIELKQTGVVPRSHDRELGGKSVRHALAPRLR